MPSNARSIAAATVAAGAAFCLALVLSSPTTAQPARGGDVVMLRCAVAGAEIGVTAYQGSTAAPGRKSGNCAESLAILMRDGFSIRDIGHYHDEKLGFVVYTLLR